MKLPVTRGKSAKQTAKAIVKEEKLSIILTLAKQGYSVYEIEERTGVPHSTAHRWMMELYAKHAENNRDHIESLREQQVARFERMLTKLDADIEVGDVDAIRTAAILNDKINRLRGLYGENSGATFNDNRIQLVFNEGISISDLKNSPPLLESNLDDVINGESEDVGE